MYTFRYAIVKYLIFNVLCMKQYNRQCARILALTVEQMPYGIIVPYDNHSYIIVHSCIRFACIVCCGLLVYYAKGEGKLKQQMF